MAHTVFERRGDEDAAAIGLQRDGRRADRRSAGGAEDRRSPRSVPMPRPRHWRMTWLIGPERAWAMEFAAFDETDSGARLLQMTRALYPHEKVGDVHYAKRGEVPRRCGRRR